MSLIWPSKGQFLCLVFYMAAMHDPRLQAVVGSAGVAVLAWMSRPL